MLSVVRMGAVGRTYGIVLKARQKETGAIVAIKKFKVRCRVTESFPCRNRESRCSCTSCLRAQESDEDEQVRKTALREVRILKVCTRKS